MSRHHRRLRIVFIHHISARRQALSESDQNDSFEWNQTGRELACARFAQKLNSIWLFSLDAKRFFISCKIDGNPRPPVKAYINDKRSRWTVTGNATMHDQFSTVECVNKDFNLTTTNHFSIAYLDEPTVETVRHDNGAISYKCQCSGFPQPTATWTRSPRLEKTLLSRINRNRAHSKG